MDTQEAYCEGGERSNDQSQARGHGPSNVGEEVDHVLDQVEVDEILPSKIDYVALLPKEVVMFMFEYLEPSDLLKSAQTSKIWRKLAEDDLLWKTKCEKASLAYCLHSQNEETLERLSKKFSFTYSLWKASFLKPYRIEENFRTKKPIVIKVDKYHFVETIRLFMSALGNTIVTSSSNSMYISSALTGKTLRTLVGHTASVMAIQMDKSLVISSSWDKSLRVWEIDTGECLHILQGHTERVGCLHLHRGIVVSGSCDTTLRMWDVQGGQFLRMLTGHAEGVCCVQYTGDLVVSGSHDGVVKLWDPETGECIRTLSGHSDPICSLKVNGEHVISSTQTTIKIWRVDTGVLENTLSNYLASKFEAHDNLLVGFNKLEGRGKIWNILTSSCLQTLDSNKIASIQFNDKFVVTGQINGKVKLWDVKTGECIKDLFRLESGGEVVKIWLEEEKIVCVVQSLRMDYLKKLEICVLNLGMVDVK